MQETPIRHYLPQSLSIHNWNDIESFFNDLISREIKSPAALYQWLKDRSELEAALQEDLGWRYIRMSCDTSNETFSSDYNFFISEIQPRISPESHKLDLKLLSSPFLNDVEDKRLEIVIRQIRKRVEIFREENIPLIAELQQKEQEFSAITAAMTVVIDGNELTLQQAGNYLEQGNRIKREEVYRKILERRLKDNEQLDNLFDELVKLRHRIALNSGFENFRDYMFASLGRFDYSPEDCYRFHEAVASEIVPVVDEISEQHRKELGIEELKPWDIQAEAEGTDPLRPFRDASELMARTIDCFYEINPFLGDCMKAMQDARRIDLESRKGKAPGGYNYPLYESGMPFIFMNSTNTLRDLVTIVHEGGHAVHSIVDKPLELVDYKNLPSEVAELASMSMELLSMEHWEHFFPSAADLRRARKKHLQDILKGLPWIAAVDAFQHWIYLNPSHTALERRNAWTEVYNRFGGNVVNWTGLENARDNLWQRQLHIYEVPFYYIEYGFAQLGALAVWRNYRFNPEKALKSYLDALKLGYTASIGEIYSVAGIRFEFSAAYVSELCEFVRSELQKLD